MTGKVPCHRSPYGYILITDKVIDQRTNRVRVNSVLWQIYALDADGNLILYSPAWVVHQIFIWVGEQGRTCYWVSNELNKMKIPPPQRETRMPRTVIKIVNRQSYTGKGEYNVNGRVPNPERSFGDPTMGVKRTLLRPKPEDDRVGYAVPALTSEELWKLANQNIKERGRGRGKQGKSIPASWDDSIWNDLCHLLHNDEWLEAQLGEEQNRLQDKDKLIQLEEDKIKQSWQRLNRIQDGWEKGVYTEADAGVRAKDLRQIIANAEQEIENITAMYMMENFNLDSLRQELLSLRSQNLEKASFEEKVEIIARLGVKVMPTEDLKTRRICCRLNMEDGEKKGGENGLTKVTFGRRYCTIDRTRTFELDFRLQISDSKLD